MHNIFNKLSKYALFAAAFWLAACSEGANGPASAQGSEDSTHQPHEMALGDAAAPVTVIEYASVTCPGCAHFHTTILPTIKQNYIDPGKVRLVFREFPTSPAQFSVAGSMLARCTAEKSDKSAYFAVIDALFSSQAIWVLAEQPRTELLKIAAQVGLNATEFDACIARQDFLDIINDNVAKARDRYGVDSTPSFIIDERVRQFRSTEEFSAALDEAIENAQDKDA